MVLCSPLTMTLKSLSRVRLFSTPWTVAYQAPPSMEFSRQAYWSGLPFPHSSAGKEFACNEGDWGLIQSREDPLEKEMATHSSILAWRIPWAEEPGRLRSKVSQESDMT